MNLSRRNLKSITNDNVKIPLESVFTLPEKVLQFGTGMLLRGLPDYFIDQANRKHIFNGRVVVVKSTSHGDVSAFKDQDGLYTVCERGVLNGKKCRGEYHQRFYKQGVGLAMKVAYKM